MLTSVSSLWANLRCEIPDASTYQVDADYERSIAEACRNERIVTIPHRCRSTNSEVSIAYHTFGSPSDPCVLLVMGLNSQSIAWDHELCEMLAAAGPFYVVRYDNRDCGKSTKFDNVTWTPKMLHYALPPWAWKGRWYCYPPYTLSDMALDGIGLLDALQIPRAHVVGVSMGGMIAQLMAIEHPSRVMSLTSIMSSVGRPGQAHAALSTKIMLLRQPKSLAPDDMAAFRVWWVQKVGGHRDVNTNRVFTLARFGAQRSTYRSGLARHTAAIMHTPCRIAGLRSLKIPSLVIHGDADILVPLDNGIDTFVALSHADEENTEAAINQRQLAATERTTLVGEEKRYVRLVVKEGMGHFLFREDFGWIVKEVVAVAAAATH